jgi:hypothetical protein
LSIIEVARSLDDGEWAELNTYRLMSLQQKQHPAPDLKKICSDPRLHDGVSFPPVLVVGVEGDPAVLNSLLPAGVDRVLVGLGFGVVLDHRVSKSDLVSRLLGVRSQYRIRLPPSASFRAEIEKSLREGKAEDGLLVSLGLGVWYAEMYLEPPASQPPASMAAAAYGLEDIMGLELGERPPGIRGGPLWR